MSVGGAQNRNRAMAIRAANLKQIGMTSRQIAAAIGKNPEQVKAIVILGQRLLDATIKGEQK